MTEAPKVGTLMRYPYLWARQADSGEAEGRKRRPCAVVLALMRSTGKTELRLRKWAARCSLQHTTPEMGCLNRKTALAMVFRLMMSAKKTWRKIFGPNRLPEVILGVEFKDVVKHV